MIEEIISKNKRIIGMWGYPDPEVQQKILEKYPQHEIVDLDVNFGLPASNILPEAYCRIITNILDNSVYLKNNIDLILASVGEEKCDSARLAATILEDLGFKVIKTKYTEYTDAPADTPISKSNLPLKDKIDRIMAGVVKPQNLDIKECKPSFGFWGVPPNDISFLELFPDTTHVYGWTRCVEAGKPADLELEMYVDKNVPTVFFAQTFCSKMQLAKYLAKKYNGLYIDVDDVASNSVRAKIEAFIKLR